MFDESTPSADDPAPGESATADAAPTWHPNGTGEDAAAEGASKASTTEAKADTAIDGATPTSDITAPDDNTAFLAELAKAMKTTVATERTRITQDADRRRDAHIAGINARRESESAKMRELAQDDLKGIDAWAERERQRIQQERERRAAGVRKDLESSLAEHRAKIDGEIQAVDAAVATYRSEVEAFFSTFDGESDPVAIAQHAGQRPVFPTLEAEATPEAAPSEAGPTDASTPAAPVATAAIAANDVAAPPSAPAAEAPAAPTEAPAASDSPAPAADAQVAAEAPAAEAPTAEPVAATATGRADEQPADAASTPMVGVMDSAKSTTKLAQAWAAWQASTEAADQARAAEQAASGGEGTNTPTAEQASPVAAGSYKPAGQHTGGPMSWLRRDKDHNGS